MTILGTTTTEAAARLIRIEGVPQDAGFKVFRGWPWLAGYNDTSGTTVKELMDTLNGVPSYQNIQANGRTYTGKYVVGETRAYDENEDGTENRDCAIVQECTLVKVPTNTDGLGTPDKNADKLTLNFLGFQEGEQEHIYHKYRNIDPATRATCMALSPTESGYTIVKREFFTEKDKTGTFYVVFEKDTWPKSGNISWANNRVRMGYDNYDNARNTAGHGFAEDYQLTGLSKTAQDTNWVAAHVSDTKARVITSVRRAERADGEYVVSQTQRIAYEGATAGDAIITKIRATLGSSPGALGRLWYRRTLEAKNTLVASGGAARSNSGGGDTVYYHREVDVSDNGDGTYNVFQTLEQGDTSLSIGFVSTFFTDSYPEVKVLTRSRDNAKKRIYYWKFVSAKPTEKSAYNFIAGKAAAFADGIVPGSDHVVKKGENYYIATCKTHQKTSGADPSAKIDNWA